jgi:aldehyde dehydrogenase (NAD+)
MTMYDRTRSDSKVETHLLIESSVQPVQTIDMSLMTSVTSTPLADIPRVVASARASFDSGRTRPYAWRLGQLKAMRRLCLENKDAITAALRADLRRPQLECVLAEVQVVVAEIDHAIKHLKEWMKPTSVRNTMRKRLLATRATNAWII